MSEAKAGEAEAGVAEVIEIRPPTYIKWMRGARGEHIAICAKCLDTYRPRTQLDVRGKAAHERAHVKARPDCYNDGRHAKKDSCSYWNWKGPSGAQL
jgi:hypothetical protein